MKSDDAGAPPPHDDSTESRILQAARAVFLRRGTAGARMHEIADEAGVNQALLHYYFRTKDRLAAAVFRGIAGRLVPLVVQLVGSGLTLEAKIERFVRLYIDTVRHNPFMPGYIVAELHHHPERITALLSEAAGTRVEASVRALLDGLDADLRAHAAAGTMRPIAAEQFLVSVMGLVVMPFIARPLLPIVLGPDEGAFDRFLDERRAELPGFILNALRP